MQDTQAIHAQAGGARFAVPGPPPARLIGRAGNVMRWFSDPIGVTSRLFKTYGRVASLVKGGGTNIYTYEPNCPGTIVAYGPDLVHQVTSQHDVYYKYPLTGPLFPRGETSERKSTLKHFGVGLFGVNGDEHRGNRRLMMPAFHKQRIESYRDDMVALTQQALDRWRPGQQLDIADALRLLTMRIATKTLFGEDIGERGGGVGQLLQDSLHMLANPLIVLRLDLPGLPYRRFIDLSHQVDVEMRRIIERRRGAGAGPDVLSMLIQARDEESGLALTEAELLGHTGVLFAAGHETSSNALTWTLFLLSQHPEVAADLVDELAGELGGSAPSVEQLQRLPLLDRVVKESMRILPPVPWNGRAVSQDAELGGHALPANTEVMLSIYHTHHMPEIYAEPERFNPRRWETISPSLFEYNPFSAGPRMCIGATFATMEIKIVLAMLLQRYRLEPTPGLTVNRSGVIVLAPARGMPMVVRAQDRVYARGAGGVRGNIRENVTLPE